MIDEDWKMLSCVQLFVAPLTVSLSMEFSKQEYWSGLPFPLSGDLPHPGIEPASLASPALQADSLRLAPSGKPTNVHTCEHVC